MNSLTMIIYLHWIKMLDWETKAAVTYALQLRLKAKTLQDVRKNPFRANITTKPACLHRVAVSVMPRQD